MSVQIDMTNYEAFYLDYLEGNLSGEALAAFEAFLLAHPDLSVEDPLMVTLEPTDESYDPIGKLALKQGIDMSDLTDTTVSYFLIARQEGLLSDEQHAQLNHWLEANAHYRQDAELYAMTAFEADPALVYEHKEALKKPVGGGRVIPMWWSGVAVAAGLALLITIGINYNSGGTPTGGKPTVVTAHNDPKTHPADTGNTTITNNDSPSQDIAHKEKNGTTVTPKKGSPTPANDQHKEKTPVRRNAYQRNNILLHETVVASLEKRNAALHTGNKTIEPMPVIVPSVKPETNESPSSDMAWVPVGDMKNPIQPVTSKLATTLNTPVDFRTAKASKRKGGGFYLKIGKLEVSHQSASL